MSVETPGGTSRHNERAKQVGERVAYLRVSTSDQSCERQRHQIEEAGGADRWFQDDGVSGMKASRPGLDAALAYLRAGDVLVVVSIDRLGRRTGALLSLIEELEERGVALHILNLGLQSDTVAGRLVISVLAAVARAERDLIAERCIAGQQAARARGARIGRPPALTLEQRAMARTLVEEHGKPIAEVARLLGVSDRTIRRVVLGS